MDRYRLAPVRDARARNERVVRGELASAVGDARAAGEVVERARARVDEARAALEAARAAQTELLARTRAAALTLGEHWCARRRRDLAEAIAAHDRARTELAGRTGAVDAAAATLARARADREVIERHFARWREAQARRVDRRAE